RTSMFVQPLVTMTFVSLNRYGSRHLSVQSASDQARRSVSFKWSACPAVDASVIARSRPPLSVGQSEAELQNHRGNLVCTRWRRALAAAHFPLLINRLSWSPRG